MAFPPLAKTAVVGDFVVMRGTWIRQGARGAAEPRQWQGGRRKGFDQQRTSRGARGAQGAAQCACVLVGGEPEATNKWMILCEVISSDD